MVGLTRRCLRRSCSGHQKLKTKRSSFFIPVTVLLSYWLTAFAVAFGSSPVPGTKEILQVTQNERKCKIFFLLYPKFGHLFGERKWKRGVHFQHTPNVFRAFLKDNPSSAALATLSAYSSNDSLTYLYTIVTVLRPFTPTICGTVSFLVHSAFFLAQ